MYPWVQYMCMHLLQRDKHSQTPIRQLCVELPQTHQTLLAAMCHQLLNASCPDSLHRSSCVFTSVGCHGGTSCHRALRLQPAMFTVFSSGPDTKSSYLNTNSGEAWSCKFQPKKSWIDNVTRGFFLTSGSATPAFMKPTDLWIHHFIPRKRMWNLHDFSEGKLKPQLEWTWVERIRNSESTWKY